MANRVQLNNIDHAALEVNRGWGAELGDAVMACPVFPSEFRQVQSSYPIVLSRIGEEPFYRPFALFGLQQGENLFLDEEGWDALYVPLYMRMQPFLIGLPQGGTDQMEVHIDLDHPRVTRDGGERVFLEQGGQTPFLSEIAGLLGDVHEAEQQVAPFSDMLEEMGLIEPFTLDVELRSGETGRLAGYSTIAEERLTALSAEELGRLQGRGYLQPLFMMVASMNQLGSLVARKDRAA
ncbi:SapC family protein [Parvularcula maris]|uniref:SapC family protein n=1 Tax=Parvularcula maris TaxID=2965077 RepID=A0A9X2L806_9PROT|nr:SapC family protein [Parvularcula maris]MCQ8184722.1 SapC family protein [Parvularcula maris]